MDNVDFYINVIEDANVAFNCQLLPAKYDGPVYVENIAKTKSYSFKSIKDAIDYLLDEKDEFIILKMKNYDNVTTNEYGTTEYTLNGKYHRLDGPAVIYKNGTQYWYQNGLLHNEYGPAEIYANGDQEWHQNGKLHRDDGPARIYSNGDKEYYKFGIQLSSLNDNLVIIAKDDYYSLYYLNGKFIAGCRNFTKQQAINHWSNPREDNKNRSKLFLIAIENFKE